MTRHPGSAEVDLADPVALCDLGRAVFTLLHKWNLSDDQQWALLAGRAYGGGALSEYQIGQLLLLAPQEVLKRVAYLMGIHASLRLLFPEDENLRFSWVRRRNQALEGSAPLDIMLRDGTHGIARVCALLDQQCTQ